MKWFIFSINNSSNHYKLDLKEKIREELKLSVDECVGTIDNCHYSFSSNTSKMSSQVEFNKIVIVGDINLHNRTELLKNNNLDNYEISEIEMLSLLYREKGISFVTELIGEFSFVLYDRESNKVYLVRDQMGIKTLFWIKDHNSCTIASDIFLLKNYFKFNDLNYKYFEEYYERNGIIDTGLTPYQGVNRVTSGSFVTIGTDVETYEYWDLSNISGTITFKSESEYFEQFRELLSTAIKDRMSVNSNNSVMMSGGLDSTSIYALAKGLENYKISPVSAVFEELSECDESPLIKELLNKYQDKGIFINCDNVLMLDDFPGETPFSYEPNVNAISFNFTFHTVKKSVDHGMLNILSGYGGDQLLTGSLYMTRDFLSKFNIEKAFSHITDYSIKTNTPAVRNLRTYTLFPNIIKKYGINENSNFYKTMSEKLNQIKYYHQKELYYQISSAKSHLYTDRVIGGITGSDINHPFLDRRLVEYMYKIPGELRHSKQFSKYILRKSMQDYLTGNILERVNKTTHLAHIYKSIRTNWSTIHKAVYTPKIINQLNLISIDKWRDELTKWRNGIKVKDSFWTLLAIELWFTKYEQESSTK